MIANVRQAKDNLGKLVDLAGTGEEVIIARNGKPAVRLIPIPDMTPPPKPRGSAA
jgi:prevent-host-death family protein